MPTEVLVPPLGQTVDTITLINWYKDEGEMVVKGEMLFTIETDKATLDIEAPASGVLQRITAQSGDEVQVLSAIGLIAAPDEEVQDALPSAGHEPSPGARREPGPGSEGRPGVQKAKSAPPAVRSENDGRGKDGRHRLFVSPRARRLAEKGGVPLEALQPTGPEGAIVERDVRAYMQARSVGTIPSAAPQVADSTRAASMEGEVLETLPMEGVRAVTAERMQQSSSTTAQVTLNAEADATVLVELRERLGVDGIEVTYNDLLLYILGQVLGEHPQLNASLEGDTIKVWRGVHIGLAVETERGLLVPVLRDVDQKGLVQLAGETQALVERARAGQCAPEELHGGTFTLTNLGMYGIDSFSPIINLPDCAILGVGRIRRRPAVVGDKVVVRRMVWLSLTFDHRLVDGAPAARLLQRVVQMIESPHLLLA